MRKNKIHNLISRFIKYDSGRITDSKFILKVDLTPKSKLPLSMEKERDLIKEQYNQIKIKAEMLLIQLGQLEELSESSIGFDNNMLVLSFTLKHPIQSKVSEFKNVA